MCIIENRIYVFQTGTQEIYEHKRLCDRAVGNMPCQWTTKEERILPAGRPPHPPRLSYDDPLLSPTSSSGFPPTPPDDVALATRPGSSRRGSSTSPQGRRQFTKSSRKKYVKPELIISIGGDSKPKNRSRPKDRRYHHGSTTRSSAEEIAIYDPPSPVSSTVAETGFMEDEHQPPNYVTSPTRRQNYVTRPVAPSPTFAPGHVRTPSRRSAFGTAGEADVLARPPPPNGPPRPPAPPVPADPPSPRRRRAFPPVVTGPHQAQNDRRSAPPLIDAVYETRLPQATTTSPRAKDKQRAADPPNTFPPRTGESEESRLARLDRERSDHRQKMRDQKRADEWQARYQAERAAAREEAREAKHRPQGSPDWEQQLQEGRERLARLKMTDTRPETQTQNSGAGSASGSGAKWEGDLQQGRERVERDRQKQAERMQEARGPRPPSPLDRGTSFDRVQPGPRVPPRIPTAGPSRTRSTRPPGDTHHGTAKANAPTPRRARQDEPDQQDQARLLAAERAQLRRERLAADLATAREEAEQDSHRRAALEQEAEIRRQEADMEALEKRAWQRQSGRATDYNPRSGMGGHRRGPSLPLPGMGVGVEGAVRGDGVRRRGSVRERREGGAGAGAGYWGAGRYAM